MKSLADITEMTLSSQISIWRIGEVGELLTAKHLF